MSQWFPACIALPGELSLVPITRSLVLQRLVSNFYYRESRCLLSLLRILGAVGWSEVGVGLPYSNAPIHIHNWQKIIFNKEETL